MIRALCTKWYKLQFLALDFIDESRELEIAARRTIIENNGDDFVDRDLSLALSRINSVFHEKARDRTRYGSRKLCHINEQ